MPIAMLNDHAMPIECIIQSINLCFSVAVRLITGRFCIPRAGAKIGSEGGPVGSGSPSSVWEIYEDVVLMFFNILISYSRLSRIC